MATLRDIRRRINSVKSTQQITKAMKMVSAAKLRRAQERLLNARPYADRLQQVLAHLTANVDRSAHPLLAVRKPESILYVLVTADRGLCGSFNANVIRTAGQEVDARQEEGRVQLVTLGKKGFEHFSRRGYDVARNFENVFDNLDLNQANEVSQWIEGRFVAGEVDEVNLVFNRFFSVAVQRPVVQKLLPIEAAKPELEKYEPAPYLYEPSAERILEEVCPRYLTVSVWRVLLESFTAEQAARMVAMESASDNAEEMIYDLTLYYNKVRQASITKEIADIVGGAEALRA